MSKHILLTISILISNRPDTVRKCLDSVQPLLKAVPSELILTDTGCGEQVRSIIEEYTNHIIQFKWCNDFSKARNVGLKQAKGKWFMFLDDDEWFEDTTEIIDFFQSGAYKKYGMGAYSQRNYGDREGITYSDLLVGRMTRLEPDVKFIYSIHECFNRVVGKVKKFNVFVHHYGYVYDTKEALHAHARRNIEPLIKELKAAPNDMKHALQLTQEYNVLDEYEKSVEIAREAIEKAKKGPVVNDFCLASLHANVVMCLMDLWRFQEVIEVGEAYLKLDALDPMAKALIAARLSCAYMHEKETEKCFEKVQYYWEVYQDYVKDDEKFITYVTNITCSCFEPYNRSIVLGNGVNAAVLMEKHKIAWEWFQAMELNIESQVVHLEPEMMKIIVEKLPKVSEEVRQYYVDMCNVFLRRQDIKFFIINEVMERCRQGETWEDKLWLTASYKDCVIEHPFEKMIKIADAVQKCDRGQACDVAMAEQQVMWLWEHLSDYMGEMKAFELIRMEEHLGLAPEVIMDKIPYHIWQRELTDYFGKYSQDDVVWWTEKFAAFLPEDSMKLRLWKAFAAVYDAIREAGLGDKCSMETVLNGLREYADNRIALCEQIYRPEILQNMQDVLAEEDQAAFRLRLLEDQIHAGEYVNALKDVKELRGLLPGLDPVMKCYLEWLSDKMKVQEHEQKKANNEFQVLAVGVKLKIRQLMAAGNNQAALTAAKQLHSLMPEDNEVAKLVQKLEGEL